MSESKKIPKIETVEEIVSCGVFEIVSENLTEHLGHKLKFKVYSPGKKYAPRITPES